MSDPRDYKLDIAGLSGASKPEKSAEASSRPYLSVQFECCSVYQRIYRDADSQHYTGACPRCGNRVRFTVGEGGSDSRFFIVR